MINAEAVMIRLARATGRDTAHELVAAAVKRAASGNGDFAAVLAADPEIGRHLSRADIDEALAPEAYLGEAIAAVERIVGGE